MKRGLCKGDQNFFFILPSDPIHIFRKVTVGPKDRKYSRWVWLRLALFDQHHKIPCGFIPKHIQTGREWGYKDTGIRKKPWLCTGISGMRELTQTLSQTGAVSGWVGATWEGRMMLEGGWHSKTKHTYREAFKMGISEAHCVWNIWHFI